MTDPTPIYSLYVPISDTFEASFSFYDQDTGAPADFTNWSGRCELRTDYSGDLVATLATSGTRDGDVRFDASGNVTLYLSDEFTTTMSPLNRGVGDLELQNPAGERFRVHQYIVKVTQGATNGQ